jgi:hypothetical protein
MSNETILLHRALQDAEKELNRLGRLIKPKAGDLPDELQQESATITQLFSDELDSLTKECEEIRNGISQRDPGMRDIGGIWARYTRLRYVRLPKLTGELLAVIGGIHLRQVGLDELYSPGISFTNVAQQLLDEDLFKRSNFQVSSLLIVAEERYEPSNTRILRLRFPACDIWHLPFTAYEHGYLFARDVVSIVEVVRLRDDVRQSVDPESQSHKWGQVPKDQSCLLPEVRQFWNDYRVANGEIKEPEAQASFYASKKPEIEALQEIQVVHLCRLLADVFATFFVGPAYTYALLHLSFEPIKLAERGESTAGACLTLNKPLSSWMPPFLQRLVVSLHTLDWMHKDALSRGAEGFGQSLFDEDPAQASGILGAYYQTCMAINGLTSPEPLKECYKATKEALGPWLKQFEGVVRTKNQQAPATLDNWHKAQELLPHLASGKLQGGLESKDFSLWAIVNAAWHARHQKEIPPMQSMGPVRTTPTQTIEERAMDLIVSKLNPEAGKGAQTGQSPRVTAMGTSQAQQEREFKKELALIRLEAQSAGKQEVVVLADDMIKSGVYLQFPTLEQFVQQSTTLGGQSTLDLLSRLSRKPQP